MSNPLSAIDRESLSQSLLIGTVKLFALAAKADDVISASESSYVREYFSLTYPTEFTNFLHLEFLRYVEEDLSIEAVTTQCRREQSYEERVFLLGKLLELLAADEITQEEWIFWSEVGDQLGVDLEDLHRLEALWLDETTPEGYSDYLRWLWVTDRGGGGDIELDAPGLRLLILRVKQKVFLKQIGGAQRIMIGGRRLNPKLLTRLSSTASIWISGKELHRLDLKFLFRRLGQPDERYPMKITGGRFIPADPETEPYFMLHLRKAEVYLDMEQYDHPLYVRGMAVSHRTRLSLWDRVAGDDTTLNIRNWLLYERNRQSQFRMEGSLRQFTIGNQYECDIQIEDELDQTWTCVIEATPKGYLLKPGGCPYPVWLNGERMRSSHLVGEGDRLRIRQTDISWDAEGQVFRSEENSLQSLDVNDLSFAFPDGTIALDEVTFSVRAGELVGILGPSGSGKSTLLNLINGYHQPEEGKVLLDGWDLRQFFDRFKDRMGFVPQDDLLFENLTVYENLYFNARLRYPGRTNDIRALVNGVLQDIGLYEQRNLKVGSPAHKILSGGQRKRLNIGLELLAENELMMFDEPTSGLSSKDSERILKLIKRLALRGKLIFVVIHQPSSRLYQQFDKVILLDRGGKLAFFGNKDEALHYFEEFHPQNNGEAAQKVVSVHLEPELLLDAVEQPLQDLDGTSLNIRRYAPDFWKKRYKDYRATHPLEKKSETEREGAEPQLPWRQSLSTAEHWSVFVTLVRRNFFNKLRDRSNLLVTFLIPPLLALLVGLILRYREGDSYDLYNNLHLVTFLFLAALIAIFLGVTNSVEEIIRDQRILLRERMLDVSRFSYFMAKVVTLGGFAVVQNLLFLTVGFLTLELKELFGGLFIILMLTSLCGIMLGLFVSSLPGLSAKGAINLVPIMLIPQIIFGGALVEYQKMNQQLTVFENSPIPEICQLMPSRWAFEAAVTLQGYANSYHPVEDSLQRELNDYRRYRKNEILAALRKELGDQEAVDSAYERRKLALEQRVEVFRQEYRATYGNRTLNGAVKTAQDDYERQLRETGSTIYPLFVQKKQVAFTSIVLPTPVYNGLVLVGIIMLLASMSLIMLYRRF